MYPSYPGGGQGPLAPRPDPPQQVLNAVKLMYAGAVLSGISFIIGLTTITNLKSAIRTADPSFTTAQVNTAVTAGLVFAGFFGVLGIALWIWMAWANRGGRSWARVVATVFFGIDTLGILFSFVRPGALLSQFMGILIWAVGLGAIILLWNRASSAYYQAISSGQFR